MELKDFVKQRRKAMGLSQRKLAKQAGVSYSYVQLIEAGKRKDISITVANKLAAAFGVDADMFLSMGHPEEKRPLLSIVAELQQRIIETEQSGFPPEWLMVPVITQSNDGDFAITENSNIQEHVVIRDSGNGHSHYAALLPACHDSTQISPGIIAIIDRDAMPKDGDLVGLHVTGKFEVRIYRYDGTNKWLEPNGVDMEQARFRGVIIELRLTAELAKAGFLLTT